MSSCKRVTGLHAANNTSLCTWDTENLFPLGEEVSSCDTPERLNAFHQGRSTALRSSCGASLDVLRGTAIAIDVLSPLADGTSQFSVTIPNPKLNITNERT